MFLIQIKVNRLLTYIQLELAGHQSIIDIKILANRYIKKSRGQMS